MISHLLLSCSIQLFYFLTDVLDLLPIFLNLFGRLTFGITVHPIFSLLGIALVS